jgi:hypothetical protein
MNVNKPTSATPAGPRNTLTNLARAGAALCLGLGLAACGGCGSDNSGNTGGTGGTGGTLTGVFFDAAVQGLDYYIDGVKAGTTNAAGQFSYTLGQAVTFRVGNVTLGTTGTGDLSTVTPADLTATPAALSNILVLLQSLDADANPANGILIPAERASALTTTTNLSASGSSLASVQANLPSLTLVSAGAASSHFLGGVASAAPNATVRATVNALVGFWHSQCDGEGYSQVTEVRKAADNKLYFARNIGRNYANANCSGSYTAVPEFGGSTQQDYGVLVGAITGSDGSVSLTMAFNVDDTTTAMDTTVLKLAASKTSFTDLGPNPWPGSIVKVAGFAFP